jgi:hypothetical protein
MKRRCALSPVLIGVCLSILLWGIPARAQEGVAETPYRADLKGILDIHGPEGRRKEIATRVKLSFRWQWTAAQRALVLTDMHNRQSTNGVEQMNNRMCRDRYEETRDGSIVTVKAKDCPAALQLILRDSFEVPLCTIAVDRSGVQVERHVSSAPGAGPTLSQAVIDLVALLPPLAATKPEYTVRTGVNSGVGVILEGEVKYTRMVADKPGQTRWQVSGQLARENFLLPGVPTPSTVRGTVSGILNYDDTTHQLLSGDCTLDLTYETIKDGKRIGSARGGMTVHVRQASEK